MSRAPRESHRAPGDHDDDDDYDPIAGQFARTINAGIMGLIRSAETPPRLAPLMHGYERVFLEREGVPAEPRHLRSRLRGRSLAWLVVDVREHHLGFTFHRRSKDGTAGFDIEVDALVQVRNAQELAERRIQGVRAYVVPALHAQIDHAMSAVSLYGAGSSAQALNSALGRLTEEIRRRLPPGGRRDIDFLRLTILSVAVNLDPRTGEHYDRLIEAVRAAEWNDSVLHYRRIAAEKEIALRAMWADYLQTRVSTPLDRAVGRIAPDPREGLQPVLKELEDEKHWTHEQVVDVLKRLLEQGAGDERLIADLESLKNMVAIADRKPQRPQA